MTPVFNSQESKNAILQYYDMLLEQAAVPYEAMNVNTRFGKTFIIASGDPNNPPLVLLHGSSMNSVMWIKDMQTFSKSFRVYALDMPGEPGRSVENQLSFNTTDYSNWLLDVFDSLSIARASLAGISLGAWLSTKFTIEHLDRVSEIILLCPAGFGSQNHAFKDIAFELLSKGEKGVDELFTKINGDNPIPEIMLNYQKLIAAGFNTRKEEIPLFTDDELKSLSVPSLMIFGGKDIMLDAMGAIERYSNLVPKANAVLLPDMGHSLTGLADDVMTFILSQAKDRTKQPINKKRSKGWER